MELEFVRPGQTLVSTGPFSSGTTVVSVDTGAATITVADFPATTETKLTNEIKENPEIVAQLLLATQMGYDINDSTDLQLFCDETNNLTTTFSDLKPYAVRKAGK